ncbi:MAG: hypothetical protein JNK45_19575 [Myxococcales bacterium]|jgi:hypothetical protein|nr:hypothetical protein [Myxococcales bacterium]
MIAGYDGVDDVAAAPRHVVLRLLQEGDAPQRVWAAWVLAMRGGVAAMPRLRRMFDEDDDIGVRRHLLVVLVGLGERALLGTVAGGDRSPLLRGEGTRYLARLAEPDDLGTYDLVLSRVLDIAWSVRATVAAELRSDAPPDVARAAMGLLFDPDLDVRRVLVERIERGDFPRGPVQEHLAVLVRAARPSERRADPRVRALVRVLRDPE